MTCNSDMAGYFSLNNLIDHMNTDTNTELTELEISKYLTLRAPINIGSRSSGIMHNDSLSADQDTTIDIADIWDKWSLINYAFQNFESWHYLFVTSVKLDIFGQ